MDAKEMADQGRDIRRLRCPKCGGRTYDDEDGNKACLCGWRGATRLAVEEPEPEIEVDDWLMPRLGDTKRDKHRNKYIWLGCRRCGKERWVKEAKMRRATFTGLCRSCEAREGQHSPEHPHRRKRSERAQSLTV